MPEAVAVLEHGLGALDVRHERAHGLLDDQPDAHRGGQVVHDVALVHELADDRVVQDRVDDEVVVRSVAQVRDVALRAGREVVERVDLPAVGEQQLGEVGADEPGAAGDECRPLASITGRSLPSRSKQSVRTFDRTEA